MYGVIIKGTRHRINRKPERCIRGRSPWSEGPQEKDFIDRSLEAVDRKLQEIRFRAGCIFRAAMEKPEDE